MNIAIANEFEMKQLGATIGRLLKGGEIIELVGDVGAGKTTLTKGIADGMRIDEDVQSPSFTISRLYDAPGNLRLAHYDFYRLSDAGIMGDELHETLHDPSTVTIIEWAEIIAGILPQDHLTISINNVAGDEHARIVTVKSGGDSSANIAKGLA